MNESELTAAQIAILLGLTCAATAVAVGLVGRAINKRREVHPFVKGQSIFETAQSL